MIAKLMRAFRPLDTTAVDAAIADAHCQEKQVRVRARALRMDISCGDPGARIRAVTAQVTHRAGDVLRKIYEQPASEDVPPSMQRLLDQL